MTGEYVAVVVLAGVLVAALVGVTPGWGATVASAVRTAICRIVGIGCAGLTGGDRAAQNRLALGCVVAQVTRDLGWNAAVFSLRVEQRTGDVIVEEADGTATVWFADESRAGLEGSFGARAQVGWGPRTLAPGRFGFGDATVGGEVGYGRRFASIDEAEAFVAARRGGWRRVAHTVSWWSGAIEEGWHGLRRRWNALRGRSHDGPEVDIVSFEASIRGRGAAGADSGPAGSVELRGQLGGHSRVTLDLNTGEHTVEHRFGGNVAGNARGPLSGFTSGLDGAQGLTVTFDAGGQPTRLTLQRERTASHGSEGGASLTGLSVPVDAVEAAGRTTGATTRVEEVHLDLRNPENRAAFDRAFAGIEGMMTVAPLPSATAWRALADRIAADGVATYAVYEGTDSEAFSDARGTGIRGGTGVSFGLGASGGTSRRRLRTALLADMADPVPFYAPFLACGP